MFALLTGPLLFLLEKEEEKENQVRPIMSVCLVSYLASLLASLWSDALGVTAV